MLCWIANPAAGVSRSSHRAASSGRKEAVASRCGTTTTAMPAVIAAGPRRNSAPSPSASTAVAAIIRATPPISRTCASPDTGSRTAPLPRSSPVPRDTVAAVAASPAAKVTAAITTALAASA